MSSTELNENIVNAAVGLLKAIKPEITAEKLNSWLSGEPPKAEGRTLPEKPLTRKEVCDLLEISLPTMHRWTKDGRLKSIKIGKRAVRIDAKSVRELLEGGNHE